MKKFMVPLAVAAVMSIGVASPAAAKCGTPAVPAVYEIVVTPGSPAVFGTTSHPAVPAVTEQVLVTPAYTETVVVSEAWIETIPHPAVTEEQLVSEAWTETIEHPAVTETIEHPAVTEQVLVSEAWSETIQHDAVYELEYLYTNRPVQGEPEEGKEERWYVEGEQPGGFTLVQPIQSRNGQLIEAAWTEVIEHPAVYETVVVTEAWTETVTTEEAWTEAIEHPAVYETVVVEEAWTETIEHPAVTDEVEHEAVYETAVVTPEVPAWNEQVLVTPAVPKTSEEVLVSEAVPAGAACEKGGSKATPGAVLPNTGMPGGTAGLAVAGLGSLLAGATLLLGRKRRAPVA